MIFPNERISGTCRYCGMHHGPKCPKVKAIEFHPNGQVARVEFFEEVRVIANQM